MAATELGYTPQTKVDWLAKDTHSQFKIWKCEVERILNGPLAEKSKNVKISHVYIWGGGVAEDLIQSCKDEDSGLKLDTVADLLNAMEDCLTHTTSFREARQEFYAAVQGPSESANAFHSRIMELHQQSRFPSEDICKFLITDKLIHGCHNRECQRKLMLKDKDITVPQCMAVMRQFESIEQTMRNLGEQKIHATSSSRDPTKQSQKKGSRKPTSGKQWTAWPQGSKQTDSK